MQEQTLMPFEPGALLAELARLLPPYLVRVRVGQGAACPFVRSLAVDMIARALDNGHTIDRSNADGPLWEWDGWLKIETDKEPIFLEVAKVGGGVLKDF